MSRTKAEKLQLAMKKAQREEDKTDYFFTEPKTPRNLTHEDFFIRVCEYCDLAINRHYNNLMLASFVGPDGSWACPCCASRLGWVVMNGKTRQIANSLEFCDVVKNHVLR